MKRILAHFGTYFLLIASIVSACKSDKTSLVSKEFRYRNLEAGEVELVWGIDGWNMLPEEMLPAETLVKNGLMHITMQRSDDDFLAVITAPADSIIDYGFLVIKDKSGVGVDVWDGDFQAGANEDEVIVTSRILEGYALNSLRMGDVEKGSNLYKNNCSVCHGAEGKGIPGLGLDLTASEFVAGKSEFELVDFIIMGRNLNDPLNTTGVEMPPRGGNAALSDADLRDIAAFLHMLSEPDRSKAEEPPSFEENQEEAKVVAGFRIEKYAVIPDKYLTSLAFGPDGKLYVLSYDGEIWSVADDNEDGIGDDPQLFKDGFEKPVGIAWRERDLYIASQGKITLLQDRDSDGSVDEESVIVAGLPAGIQPVHANNDLTFGPDGRLYFGVGSTSDSSPEAYEYAASILSVNPDGSDLRVEAKGVRNSYEVGFNAAGDMFATDNTPDGEPVVSTSPPEEFNHIIRGGDYGFPNYYGQPGIGSEVIGPLLNLPVRSAPSGLLFYYADQFPPEYEGNAFVALWAIGQVYRVQLAETPDGKYLARGTLFASGIPGVVDIAVGPEGSLYISASENSTIYKIASDSPQ